MSGPVKRSVLIAGHATSISLEPVFWEALRNTALLIEEPTGGGHVVLFANEPLFRAWWHALDRLVLNAIVLGPSF